MCLALSSDKLIAELIKYTYTQSVGDLGLSHFYSHYSIAGEGSGTWVGGLVQKANELYLVQF